MEECTHARQALHNLQPHEGRAATSWQTPLKYECCFHSYLPIVLAHQGFLDKIYGHDAPGEGGLGALGQEEHMEGEHFKICIGATCSMTFHHLQELVRSQGVIETLGQHG